MAAEHGSGALEGSSSPSSSKRRQTGDGAASPMRGLSPERRDPSAMEDSPKRFSNAGSRKHAPSPPAPTKDMMIQELTQAYQHLVAQAALDKQWVSRAEGAVTDHALWLNRHSAAGNSVAARLDALAAVTANLTMTMTADDSATVAATAPISQLPIKLLLALVFFR